MKERFITKVLPSTKVIEKIPFKQKYPTFQFRSTILTLFWKTLTSFATDAPIIERWDGCLDDYDVGYPVVPSSNSSFSSI